MTRRTKQVLLKESDIVNKVIKFAVDDKVIGNWYKADKTELHQHGVDIILTGGKKNGERFIIECKGKSYAKTEKSRKAANSEGWLNALGQIITRMNVKKINKAKGTINGSYKYGLGLYWQSAKVVLRRIPKEAAQVLNLYIFSVNDSGKVKYFTPSMFGNEYPDEKFR